jgi:hypothetical protein
MPAQQLAMKTTTSLPANYARHTLLEPSKRPSFVIGAVVSGIALLLISGWLLVLFVNAIRPSALDGMRLRDLFVTTPSGVTFAMPAALFRDSGIALIAVLFIHELVHGLFYWLFSKQPPKFGFRGLFPYAAAPLGVYFPRRQFLVVGLAPLLLLTAVGLLLIVVAPVALVPGLWFFVIFNTAGSAGDLMMIFQLMSFSSDTLMEDNDAGVTIYEPKRNEA